MARSAVAAFFRSLRLLHFEKSYLRTSGLLRSFREDRPVDASGQPLPWINYPLIELLNERLTPRLRVFEYGSGYSTLYFAARCASVTSVEHDAAWLAEVRGMAPANVVFIEAEPGAMYPRAIEQGAAPFDLVLIDGLDREHCLPIALARLDECGVVILDDSHRAAYSEAISRSVGAGFRALRLRGPKPNSLTAAESLVLYRDDNCLGL